MSGGTKGGGECPPNLKMLTLYLKRVTYCLPIKSKC